MEIEPVPIKMYGDPDADKKFKKTVRLFYYNFSIEKSKPRRRHEKRYALLLW